jgi:hypothetical protein
MISFWNLVERTLSLFTREEENHLLPTSSKGYILRMEKVGLPPGIRVSVGHKIRLRNISVIIP